MERDQFHTSAARDAIFEIDATGMNTVRVTKSNKCLRARWRSSCRSQTPTLVHRLHGDSLMRNNPYVIAAVLCAATQSIPATAALAPIGSDDFNDNARSSANWGTTTLA